MIEPAAAIHKWRTLAEERRQDMLEKIANALPERTYLVNCGALKELDFQIALMHNILTGKTEKGDEDGDDKD